MLSAFWSKKALDLLKLGWFCATPSFGSLVLGAFCLAEAQKAGYNPSLC
jgi:hypothetical protein